MVAERRAQESAFAWRLAPTESSVLAGVMKEGLVLAGIGVVVVGLSGAIALNRLIAALLFGVQPTDVSTAAGVAATMNPRSRGGLLAAGLAGIADSIRVLC